MNKTNRSDNSEATTGKKRKTTDKWQLPAEKPKPPKRTEEAVSREDLSEERSMAPTGPESSSATLNTHPDLLYKTHFNASHFSGAHHFVSNGGTYNNILGNYVVMAEQNKDSEGRTLEGIVKGSPVLSVEDMSLERQIYKGCGYRLHAAKISGKIIALKVYEGSRARERCSETARFNQKVIHPNILHMIGVSPFESELPFLVFDGECEGAVDYMLGQVLKKDIMQSLTLGLQTVIGLSSGLDYLQDLKYPFAFVGLDHFVILSCKGKVVISFDPEDLGQINQSDQLRLTNNADRALLFFHELCQRTFDGACKAHYESQQIQRAYVDEFDLNVDDLPEELDDAGQLVNGPGLSNSSTSIALARPPTLGRPSPRGSPRRPSGRRQELVWKPPVAETATLDDISRQFQDFLNASHSSSESTLNRRRGRYTTRTSHRCPGYNRIEITLTTTITRSAIVSHSSPTPREICPICKEVVNGAEIFNCMCGDNDDESMPTVRCTSCSEWHHRPCVYFLDFKCLIFVCDRCQKKQSLEQQEQEKKLAWMDGYIPSGSRGVDRNMSTVDEREGKESLVDEITRVLMKLSASKIKLEKHDLTKKRTCTLSLHGPWGEKSSVFMRVTFTFPRDYPQGIHPHGTPLVNLERTAFVSMRVRAYILKHLRRICEHKRPCLEACLRFLRFADEGGNDGDLMDSESSSEDEGGQPSTSGEKSRDIVGSVLSHPRTSQGAFGPNGDLIRFFRASPRLVVSQHHEVVANTSYLHHTKNNDASSSDDDDLTKNHWA